MSSTQYATFYLGASHLGVDVLQVQEVLRHQPMTPVPRAGHDIRGLINLRGQIVMAVDLRLRLGMDPSPEDKLPMNVIIRTPEGPMSLLVDSIGDVLTVDGDMVEAPPETMNEASSRFIAGVHKLESELLAVLDVERLLSPS